MVGVLNTLVDFGAFNLLVFVFGMPVLVAYPFSVTAGIVNSFLWNKHWTFSAGGSAAWRREAVVFLGVSAERPAHQLGEDSPCCISDRIEFRSCY